jgi:cyclic pyranopterin phosphate synthase
MLIDGFGRVIDYLRISVTDRCNMRCLYCMPDDHVSYIPHDRLLRYEEILRLSVVFARLGIRKIRVTGGEPLIRKNILSLFSGLRTVQGIEEIVLTTNGLLLGRYADSIREAGIRRVNVSIDTLRPAVFRELTGSEQLQRVIDGITGARQAGLMVKLNVVAIRNVNAGEYDRFLAFALEKECDLRFIELMPQALDERFASEQYVSEHEILEGLKGRYRLRALGERNDRAKERLYGLEEHAVRVGFISPVSDPFCSQCNRLRLMPDGELKSCLFGEGGVNLRDILRTGGVDSDIARAARETVKKKPERHRIGCEDVKLIMHRTGG